MKFNRKIFKRIDRKTTQLIIKGLLVSLIIILCFKARLLIGLILLFGTIILISAIGGWIVGAIAGSLIVLIFSTCETLVRSLGKWGSKFIPAWQPKQGESGDFNFQPISTYYRVRSVRLQLQSARSQSRTERLRLITELQACIRARSPNLSIQDLQDLNFLGRERQQIIDEASWSPVRRSRVNRIAEIRSLRQANGQILPSGLVDREEEIEFTITSSSLDNYGVINHDEDDCYGIGDLTCEYNAHSLFLRCAVHPSVETCEGCRDYRSRDINVDGYSQGLG